MYPSEITKATLPLLLLPKGSRGCLMSRSCLESQGWHLIPLAPLLFVYLFRLVISFSSSANGPFSRRFSLDNCPICLVKRQAFFVWLLPGSYLIVGRRSVQIAVIRRWYLPLGTYATFSICFCPFLFFSPPPPLPLSLSLSLSLCDVSAHL